MPRPQRIIVAEGCYHFINRGNQRATVFHNPADYQSFLALIDAAQERVAVPILAACLMPNHVHLVIRPHNGAELASWARWLFTTHARRYHAKYGTTGRVWQGRFKAFAIQQDHHLLTVLRYVERNAQSARLVTRAEDWHWGSLRWRSADRPPIALEESPVPLPGFWSEWVNQPQTTAELSELRTCANRQRPFGSADWVKDSAAEMEIGQSLKPIGRPRKWKSVPDS